MCQCMVWLKFFVIESTEVQGLEMLQRIQENIMNIKNVPF